jgi:sulfur carrier protein
MAIVLNGKMFDIDCPVTIKDLLSSKGISADRVAIEVNYQIILKQEWDSFMINDGDQVEVLQFVGGG